LCCCIYRLHMCTVIIRSYLHLLVIYIIISLWEMFCYIQGTCSVISRGHVRLYLGDMFGYIQWTYSVIFRGHVRLYSGNMFGYMQAYMCDISLENDVNQIIGACLNYCTIKHTFTASFYLSARTEFDIRK
jgi:hypothetical protein